MAQPTRTDVRIDAPLTNVAVAYLQAQEAFIATKVFPIVPVDKQTNKYFKFDKDAWFRDDAQVRKTSAETAGSGFTLSNDNYSCDVFGIHKDIDFLDRANQDEPVDLDRAAAEWVAMQLLIRQEVQFVSDAFKTSVWATDKVGGTNFVLWSDFGGSDPREDIDAGKEAILLATGFEPNVLTIGYQVFRKLRRHPDVVEQFKYSSPDSITTAMLARFFDIDQVLVARAVKNTAKEGQTFAGAFTHGKNALLTYRPPNPGIMVPAAGYTFSWTEVVGGMNLLSQLPSRAVSNPLPIGIARINMPQIRSDRIEGLTGFDNKIVGTDLGYFFSAAVA